MNQNFQKNRYSIGNSCSISHTIGISAEQSTLQLSHYTTSCMFYYFIKGNGNIKIEGRNHTIEEGDIIMVNPSELYMCEIYGNKLHERLVLRVNKNILENFSVDGSALLTPFYEREKGNGNRIPAKTVESLGIKLCFEKIFTCAKSLQPTENILAVCKTIEMLDLLCKYIIPYDRKNDCKQENTLVNDVLLFLNEHFCENLSVSSVAAVFNIDQYYLSHLFREYVGISLWNYVVCKRLNHFNNLICQNYSIEEAYLSAGFQNYSNFFRLYKKYMNMTPSEFKRTKNI